MLNPTTCCVALVTVAMVAQLGFSRSLKKQHAHGGRRHLDIDDSFDPDWSSVRSVDDVASWFSLFEDTERDSVDKDETLHQHEVIADDSSKTSSAATKMTTTATTSMPIPATSTTPTTPLRQSRSNHATSHSRKPLTTTMVATPATVTPTATAETLKGILEVRNVDETIRDRTTSEDSNDDDDDNEEHHDEADLFDDPCRGVYCRAGRVCKPNKSARRHGTPASPRGRCVCADADFCASTADRHQAHHLVCGSDGSWYPSHCELHRIACVTGTHISVDRSATSCTNVSPDTTTTHLDGTTPGKPTEIETEVTSAAPVNSSAVLGIEAPRECTLSKFERMKTNLLAYHCARDTTNDCGADFDKKKSVVTDMFDYYDWSGDNRLETNEMVSVEQRDHLDRLSQHCRLEDMLVYSDKNKDGFIDIEEFYTAFGIEAQMTQERIPEVFKTTVSFGNSVELKCDSSGENGHVTWKRNGNDLSDLQSHHIKVFADGSLYIGQLTLHHIGNYTCHTGNKDDVIQTHILLVQMPPKVEVNPHVQRHIAGSTAALKCRANGLPTPQVSWELDDTPLTSSEDAKGHLRYNFMHNNATLEVKSWLDESTNSATYKCVAKNLAGASQDSATVFIEPDVAANYLTADSKPAELVAVFHSRGYTVYELNRCHVDHEVNGEFQPIAKLPSFAGGSQSSTPDLMCSSNVSECSWSDAVNVRGQFIYAAQPALNRIIVVEVVDRLNPIEVIMTDDEPVALHYVEHLDQVWVSCRSSDVIVAMVIRDASENVIHHAVHVHSDTGFNQVSGLFLPSSNDLAYSSDIGYASSTGKTSLQKIDLVSVSYIGDIDLSDHMCVPAHIVFLPIGGRVVISCASPDDSTAESKKQLVLDYVSNRVIETLDLAGKPFVSPDLRHLVILSSAGKTISAFTISEDGAMSHSFDEHTEMRLSHVTFFPSAASHGYTVYAASSEHSTVLQLDLISGRVQLIKGAELSTENANTRTAVIVSGSGQFAGHVVTLADNSVIVIDGARHHVDCEWQGVAMPRLVVSLAGYK